MPIFVIILPTLLLTLTSCASVPFSELSEQQQKERACEKLLKEDSDYQNVKTQLDTVNRMIVRTRISLFGQGLTGASNSINKRSNIMNEYNMQNNHTVLSMLQMDKAKLENWLKTRERLLRQYINENWNYVKIIIQREEKAKL